MSMTSITSSDDVISHKLIYHIHRGITAVQISLSLSPNQAGVLLISASKCVRQAYNPLCTICFHSTRRRGQQSQCSTNPTPAITLCSLLCTPVQGVSNVCEKHNYANYV